VTAQPAGLDRIRRGPLGGRWLLAALCIAAPIVEALILQSLSYVSALPLAPQVSAPAPFGVFHDLRWVFTYAAFWPSALWELVALWLFRSVFDALIVGAAWPEEAGRPSFGTMWGRSVVYTALAIVVMSPWAAFSFAASVVSFGWFLLGAIVAALLTALVMPPALISGAWRRLASWRAMALLAATWLALMIAALAITFSPPWITVIVAAAAGGINALLWRRLVRSALAIDAPRGAVPTAPIALGAVVVIFVAGGGYVYGWLRTNRTVASPSSAQSSAAENAALQAGEQPVVFVNGFGSRYDGQPHQLLGPGLVTWTFSYAGLDAQGRPRPYAPEETYQSLARSAHLLSIEVDHLHELTGKAVVVIAESEGTMVTATYFATDAHPPVSIYIQSSPLMRPVMTAYPPAGQAGFGWTAGWEVRELMQLARMETPAFKANPDIPFVRSLLTHAPRYRDQALCPAPGVRSYMFVPVEEAVMVGPGPLARIPWVALPGWHATLLRRGAVQQDVRRLLKTGDLPNRPAWRFLFQILRGGASAWHAPALPLSLQPAWHAAAAEDPAFGGSTCPTPQYSSNMR
jgi:hypothetical protein